MKWIGSPFGTDKRQSSVAWVSTAGAATRFVCRPSHLLAEPFRAARARIHSQLAKLLKVTFGTPTVSRQTLPGAAFQHPSAVVAEGHLFPREAC